MPRFSELEDSIPTSSRDTFDSFCSCVSNPSLNPALTSILSMDLPRDSLLLVDGKYRFVWMFTG